MSLQQELAVVTDDGMSVSQVKYPSLGTVAPPAQYINMAEEKETVSLAKEITATREDFLVAYYKKILQQHTTIFGCVLFGLMDWVGEIVVDNHWWGSSFRWTFFLDVALLILIALGLPITRQYRCIVKHQEKIFNLQTVLIAFLLIGIGYAQKGNRHYGATIWWIIITLIILITHSIAQIILVKKNATHYYTVFMKFAIMGSITLNFIVALFASELDRSFPIAEAIIIYSLYYFNQLNEHLLKRTSELPEEASIMDRIRTLDNIKQLINQETGQAQVIEQLKDTHCVINRYLAVVVVSGIAYIGVLILSIVTGNALFIVSVVVASVSLLSVVLNTQVASRSLQHEDVAFAVCLTYLDLASPLKNILRGIIGK